MADFVGYTSQHEPFDISQTSTPDNNHVKVPFFGIIYDDPSRISLYHGFSHILEASLLGLALYCPEDLFPNNL